MCWITFSPKDARHAHFHGHDSDSSSTEHIVRRDDISFKRPIPTTLHTSHHHDRVRIVAPSLPLHLHHHHAHPHLHHRHHHHHHDMHPLHLHPVARKLHGPGKKRAPMPKPPPPRNSSKDNLYRIQPIAEPPMGRVQIRESTRVALREARPERGRLRRVAGYEVLGRQVPWSWECVSSVR